LTLDARSAAVIAVALAACIWDVRTGRIPNALTFGAAAAALAFSLVQGGLAGLGWSAVGWLTAAVLFFPVFVLRGMGAGDVKLLAALGAWFGGPNVLYLAVYTALAGGAMAFLAIAWSGYVRETFRNLWLMLNLWRTVGFRPVPGLTLETSRGPRLAYAVPIAAGALTTLWLR
jgi:prepilin peptidase CpaA